MLFTELQQRVRAGEVCIVENINDQIPEDFIRKNLDKFRTWTIQDDIDAFGILWIFDEKQRPLWYQDVLSAQPNKPAPAKRLTVDPRRVK